MQQNSTFLTQRKYATLALDSDQRSALEKKLLYNFQLDGVSRKLTNLYGTLFSCCIFDIDMKTKMIFIKNEEEVMKVFHDQDHLKQEEIAKAINLVITCMNNFLKNNKLSQNFEVSFNNDKPPQKTKRFTSQTEHRSLISSILDYFEYYYHKKQLSYDLIDLKDEAFMIFVESFFR